METQRRRVRTALIGCGKVGDTHAQALAALPESQLVAVFDSDGARATQFAERYGVRGYSNLTQMLRQAEAEMVSICTPHPTHAALVVACAEARVHALVEKPLAVNLADADRAIAAAQRAQVKLGVVSQRRFYEPVQRVKQAIESGKIGKPILGTIVLMGWRGPEYYQLDPWRGKWDSEGGGVLANQSCHQLDLFQWLMGPIAELSGYWGNLNHPSIEVEDTAVAAVRFKSGALGTILVSNSQNPGLYGQIHVHGENGASMGVQTDGGSSFVSGVTETVEPPINDLWTVPGQAHLLPEWQAQDRARVQTIDPMNHYHRLQIQDFIGAIVDDRPPAVDGREGRKLVEIIVAIYRSQRDRRAIRFPLPARRGSRQFDGRLTGSLTSEGNSTLGGNHG
jgi:UDP-N-acetyl-2-amino-2-deoxyglucuronate dehydrogenase